MAAVRIRPVDPPYSSEMQADFDKLMRGSPPLLLLRTVAFATTKPSSSWVAS